MAGGLAEIEAVAGTRDEWVLRIDGMDQSHVDLADPTHLVFDYVRWLGDLVDLLAEPGEPLHTVHVGGGAATLARYIAAARPGSRQVVLDVDGPLMDLVRDRLDLRSTSHLKIRATDGRAGLAALADHRYGLVVRDAFAGMAVPAHLATTGFVAAVERVLQPGGVYAANLSDRMPFDVMRAEAATALSRWRHVVAVVEPSTLRGRRIGNVVLAASDRPLPVAALSRRLAGGPVAARLLDTTQLRSRIGARRPLADGDPSPAAPVRPRWM